MTAPYLSTDYLSKQMRDLSTNSLRKIKALARSEMCVLSETSAQVNQKGKVSEGLSCFLIVSSLHLPLFLLPLSYLQTKIY
jgi:hypothetical protein